MAKYNLLCLCNSIPASNIFSETVLKLWILWQGTVIRYISSKTITILFLFSATMRRIDLTGNLVAEIEDFKELNLAENLLTTLPMSPTTLVSFNGNSNKLKTQGVKANSFKVS